ncbi:MAG: UDP-3-O-(3-hydroxymyristoyl)glucosamine N-acyltransferase [Rhodospirillaceae bacterium]|nr:UDP-3-O-(3-hydroxymyristoyl)glucosamine N-acyltransferase [Rhodospirillaceae bacterium]
MPDPRFYHRAGPISAAQAAGIVGAVLPAGLDAAASIADVATFADATPRDAVFLSDKTHLPALAQSKAGFCFVAADLAASVPGHCAALTCKDPRAAFAMLAAHLYPDIAPTWGTSAVAPDAEIGVGALIAPNAVIGAKAKIGAGCKIGPHAVIGPGVVLGDTCIIGANVTITFSIIGARVIVHPGVQIGQDGFGYVATPAGPRKVPQLGRVMIHDDVEIGANCTIDRGSLADTIIGRATKLDNLVQIGHNVVIGQACILVAQSGVAGSCTIGDGVIIGGQVGIADHVTIGAGAQIASQSGLMRDVAPGEKVMGYPAKPVRQFFREVAALEKLAGGKTPKKTEG